MKKNLEINQKVVVFDEYEIFKDYNIVEMEEADLKIYNDYNNLLEKEREKNYGNTTFISATNNGIKNYRTYNLNEFYSLYTELAKVQPNDIESLLQFSKSFGIPNGLMEFVIPWNKEEFLNQIPVSIPATFLDTLSVELTTFKETFNIFKNIKMHDFVNMKKQEKLNMQSIYETNVLLFNALLKEQKKLSPLFNKDTQKDILDSLLTKDEENLLRNEIDALIAFLNPKRRDFTPEIIYEEGKFKDLAHFYNLFEFAYHQIIESLYNDTKLRNCNFCGHVFEIRHESSQFCPPLPFKKLSSCRTKFNNNKKRNNKNS